MKKVSLFLGMVMSLASFAQAYENYSDVVCIQKVSRSRCSTSNDGWGKTISCVAHARVVLASGEFKNVTLSGSSSYAMDSSPAGVFLRMLTLGTADGAAYIGSQTEARQELKSAIEQLTLIPFCEGGNNEYNQYQDQD